MDNVEKRKEDALKIQRDIVTEAIARDWREIVKKRPRDEDAEPAVQRRFRRQAETLKDAFEIQTMMTKLEQDMQKVIRLANRYSGGYDWHRLDADFVAQWRSDCHTLASRIRDINRAAIDQAARDVLIAARDMATACAQKLIANELWVTMGRYKTALSYVTIEFNSLLPEQGAED